MPTEYLVAFYSMTGNTSALARELAGALGADLEEIREARPRRGWTGVVRAAWDALRGRDPALLPAAQRPAQHRVLVLGGPVWAGRIAPPVRAWAKREGMSADVAYFCTFGGDGADRALAGLAAATGVPAVATLAVDAAHLAPQAHAAALQSFVARLRSTVPAPVEAPRDRQQPRPAA